MLILSIILKRLPWILLILALVWIGLSQMGVKVIPESTETRHSLVLETVEALGKLEIVKYNFQEITELKKISAELDLKIFKIKGGPDSKAVLITKGEAVGCIDLTKIRKEDIYQVNDTTYLKLPAPELCYYKINLQESQIYDLDLGYLSREQKARFMDELYSKAETELKNAALKSGILNQVNEGAVLLLEPLLESISNQKIILQTSSALDSATQQLILR